MHFANFACKSAELERVISFCETATGCAVVAQHKAGSEDFVQFRIGDVLVNGFSRAIYEEPAGPPLPAGWLHISLFCEDLDKALADESWSNALTWGPREISTTLGDRRIAFFEPAVGVRVELMQETRAWMDQVTSRLASLGASTVYEAQDRRGAMDAGISSLVGGGSICAPALPVRCHPGDNLALHRAVAAADAGVVLIVDGGGLSVGYLGEVLAVAAQARGIVAAVVDGGIRDIGALEELGLPVWARARAIRAASKTAPGTVGEPAACGGVQVGPGDLIVADLDGVTVVKRTLANVVCEEATKRHADEAEIKRRLRDGALTLDLLGLRSREPS